MNLREHWDQIYDSMNIKELGWYEETPQPSIDLLNLCDLDKKDLILNIGAGASTFVDYLLEQGYQNIVATDISETGLQKLRERISTQLSNKIRWITDDLTKPTELGKLNNVALWHDRAVLHFLTEPKDQDTYFKLLRKVLKPNGYVIIAAFSLSGARMCSGLDVFNYNSQMFAEKLGQNFSLVNSFDYVYTMPSGEKRDYIYTLFQKSNQR